MEISKNGYKLRVKTGCDTCRMRKVKCDEAKPHCLRCVNTARKCDGYIPLTTSRVVSAMPPQKLHRVQCPDYMVSHAKHALGARARTSPEANMITPQPSTTQFDSVSQRDAFNFFVSCTTRMSSLYYGNGFWSQFVLKLSHTVPAIRYALCSLSELHRTFQIQHSSNDPSKLSEHRENSIAQYGLAIKHTQTILAEVFRGRKDRLVEGLILCVLFVCYENLIGHFKIAEMHLQNGLKILANESKSNSELSPGSREESRIPKEIIGVFHRLDLQSMSFADASAPYPYGQYSQSIKTGPKLPASDNLCDLTESLTDCFRWIFTVANTTAPEPISKRELEMTAIFLRLWDLQFKRVISSYDEHMKISVWGNLKILELYHFLMTILVAVGVYGDEMLHDHHEGTYTKIVQISEAILDHQQKSKNCYIFTFEMGIILPLSYTAQKCRNASIRRHALRLMFSAHYQEGSWESVAAGQIAEFVVNIEERSLDPKNGVSSIPPNARVHMINAHVNVQQRYIELGCLMRDISGKWYRESLPEIVLDEPRPSTKQLTSGVGILASNNLETYWKQRNVIPSSAKVAGIDSWTAIGSMVFHE